MTARSSLALLVAVVAAAAGARAASAQGLVAAPQVLVIDAAVDDTATGAIVLRNTGTASVVASEIAVEPGCDAAVQAAPLTGFTLGPGDTRSIGMTCAAHPAGLARCGYRVRSPSDAVLLAFETVCTYADTATLAPRTTAIDFGEVAVGALAPKPLEIDNAGQGRIDRIFIETTDLAGNFTVAAPCNPDARACSAAIPAIAAGATTTLTVACTPRTPGVHTAQLHVVSAAGTRLGVPVALSCTGTSASTPVLSASPSVVDVGAIEVINATAATTVHVTNAGAGTLQLLDVQIIDGGTGAATDWTATVRTPCSATVPPGCAIEAAHTVDIDLVFDPAAIGVRDATLLLHFSDTAERSTAIPLRAIGRGATLELVGGQTVLDFGTLPVNTSASLTFDVANRGTRALRAGSITVAPSASPFTVAPSPSFTVETSAPTSVTVTCRPTAAELFTAQLELAADDAQSRPIAIALRCAGDDVALLATPPAILFGEVRTGTSRTVEAELTGVGGMRTISSIALEAPDPSLVLVGMPGPTPVRLNLTASPTVDGSLANRIVVTSTSPPPVNPQLAIAVSGTAVTPDFRVPLTLSLGTFCVDQPTTPRIIQLDSIGTGSFAASQPVLQGLDSPFDLQLIAPLLYPATLAPGERALLAVTPRRRATAAVATDEVVWVTDISNRPETHTKVTATFVDDGGAIAPTSILFEDTPIHLDIFKPREVTLQNCDASPLQLDPPQISPPFAIDSPNFPTALQPGEIATFSVGFHPTTVEIDTVRTLTITSPQLREPLTVTLTGTSFAMGPGDDGGNSLDSPERTSFYTCGGCASSGGDLSGALVVLAAALVQRRRRR